MKIILACMLYDYGIKERGYSYEYYNFYLTFKEMGFEIILYDYMTRLNEVGKDEMNRELVHLVSQEKPDLVFFSLFKNEFLEDALTEIRNKSTTLNFFHDDTWRIEFTNYWLKYFDYFTTPDYSQYLKYQSSGISNALHCTYGINDQLYFKKSLAKNIDVSFIGAWHPYRSWIISALQKANIAVHVAGHKWPNGIVSHDEMVDIFSRSKIVLNLSNSSCFDISYLLSSPYALINLMRSKKNSEQIKARHFEICGTGSLQLSYQFDSISHYFNLGKEIVCFNNQSDLINKVKYYLNHDEERERIALAGYERVREDHYYSKRFSDLFKTIGLIAQ